MNSITIYGRMVSKPLLKTTNKNDEYATGSIACNMMGNNDKSVIFFYFNAYGQSGQYATQYLLKGDPVFVIGELRSSAIDRSKPILYISKIKKIGRRPQAGELESEEQTAKEPTKEPTEEQLKSDTPF